MTVTDEKREAAARQRQADRQLGYYGNLPFEMWEPKPPYFNALYITDDGREPEDGKADIHDVAKFFRYNGCDATLQYNRNGSGTLTVRRQVEGEPEELVVVISPHQYLVNDGRGTYRAIDSSEFRRDHRKSPANG